MPKGNFTCALQYAGFQRGSFPTVLMHRMFSCLCVSEMAWQRGGGGSPPQPDISGSSIDFHWNIYKVLDSGHCQLRR